MTERVCKCGATELKEINESHSLSLYAHTDKWVQCRECGEIMTHGIPDDHENGMAFYDAENGYRYKRPKCCNAAMQPTKIWRSEDSVQFKCSNCYRVESKDPDDDDVKSV